MKVSIEFKQVEDPFPLYFNKAEITDVVEVAFSFRGEYVNVYKKGGAMMTIYMDKLERFSIQSELLKGEK